MPAVSRDFFLRDVDVVARDLVGALLVKDDVTLRITECEAYGPEHDSAAHCRAGRTPRTEPMYREGGRAYVYLCYGIHWMLNLTTGAENDPHAVLIRSVDIVAGLDTVLQRRRVTAMPGPRALANLVAGPGKVAQALALDGTWNHHDLCADGDLEVHAAASPRELLVGARVGIDYADPADRKAQRRYALAACDAVTERVGLRPIGGVVSRRRTSALSRGAKTAASRR